MSNVNVMDNVYVRIREGCMSLIFGV